MKLKQNRTYPKGFTLIELLVVVLIIAILAAVAVPQYRKAVLKSRIMGAITILKTITDAQEVYYLANGNYTDSLDNLGVSIQADSPYTFGCNMSYHSCSVRSTLFEGLWFEWRLHHVETGTPASYGGRHWCLAAKNDQFLNSICESYGPKDIWSNTYNYYKMN